MITALLIALAWFGGCLRGLCRRSRQRFADQGREASEEETDYRSNGLDNDN